MTVTLSPQKVRNGLLVVVALLVGAHLVAFGFRWGLEDPPAGPLLNLFDLDREHNLPTIFSGLMHFACAPLLCVAAYAKRTAEQSWRPWLVLAAIFVFLGVDEMMEIHEKLIAPFHDLVDARGVFFFAWVIPYGLLVLVFAASYLRFWWRLPGHPRLLFFIAGAVYVGGALGFELLGGRHVEAHGDENMAYVLYTTTEETMEMLGVVTFFYALLIYLEHELSTVRFRFREGDPLGGAT